MAELISRHSCNKVYVTAFTDDVGSEEHQILLSTGQAQAMLTFLWAKGVNAERLSAEGYGKLFPVGDNTIIHGSAYNRRIEIQWWKNSVKREQSVAMSGTTK